MQVELLKVYEYVNRLYEPGELITVTPKLAARLIKARIARDPEPGPEPEPEPEPEAAATKKGKDAPVATQGKRDVAANGAKRGG